MLLTLPTATLYLNLAYGGTGLALLLYVLWLCWQRRMWRRAWENSKR